MNNEKELLQKIIKHANEHITQIGMFNFKL